MKNKRKWNFFKVVLAVLAFMIPVFTFGQNVGDAAPDFTLSEYNGGPEFNLADQHGKVVFIFFFGYACPHCLANGNNTEKEIYDKFKNDPDFVAVGVDTWDGDEKGVEDFQSTTGITYPLCLMASDLLNKYSITYDRIVVVDKDGIIQFKSTANSTSGIVKQAADAVDASLQVPTAVNNISDMDKSLKIYPVPARNIVQVDGPLQPGETARVRLISAEGTIVAEETVNTLTAGEKSIHIPVRDLTNGIYIVQYTTPGITLTKKLVVNK